MKLLNHKRILVMLLFTAFVPSAIGVEDVVIIDNAQDQRGQQSAAEIGSLQKENAGLKALLADACRDVSNLRQSLTAAGIDSIQYRQQAHELLKRMQMLGAKGTDSRKNTVDRTLLDTLGECEALNAVSVRLTTALLRLSNASIQFSKSALSNDANARLVLESETRNANETLGLALPIADELAQASRSYSNAIIVSIRPDLGILVVNSGSSHGIKIGMPLRIIRSNQIVGDLRVVDVRERICGTIVQNLVSKHQPILIGDCVKFATSN